MRFSQLDKQLHTEICHQAPDSQLKAVDIKGLETLFATSVELTFDIQISDESAGRRAVRTPVIRALLKDSSIRFGAKNLREQLAYLRFAHALGAPLARADLTATVSVREGPMPERYDLGCHTSHVGPLARAV